MFVPVREATRRAVAALRPRLSKRCSDVSSLRADSSRGVATRAQMYYQGPGAPASVLSTGQVGTYRDGSGSDGEFFGVDPTAVEVDVADARVTDFSLDANGFTLVSHPWQHIDYYDNNQVLDGYYPECESLVCKQTGATFAVAFDHNLRSKSKKTVGEKLTGGNAVQEPLITYGVHNDYSVTSAPSRIRQLAQPPKHNDTLRPRLGDTPAVDPSKVEALLRGRWVFINVWRNIAESPVERFPLGLCDAATASKEDLVVFEIRYSDRVGENYFAQHSIRHKWYYYPRATRDEAILLKCWDSRGQDFADMMPQKNGVGSGTVPATFSLHSGFVDPATRVDAPDRESIEVRLVAFFEDE